ncbi:MAG: hypothetical protein Q9160_007407 [Pyrenula sp. 1 TL-2023]
MKFTASVRSAFYFLSCCGLAHSWVLDAKSCGPRKANAGDEDTKADKLVATIDSATSMLSRADGALNEWDTLDDNFKNFYGYIFKKNDNAIFNTVKVDLSQGIIHNGMHDSIQTERAASNTADYKKDANEIVRTIIGVLSCLH